MSSAIDEIRAAKLRALIDTRWFFERVLRFPLIPWQYRLVDAVLDLHRRRIGIPTVTNHEGKPRITARSCHGTGKTQAMAGLMHIWNFIHSGTKIACTAPKQDQLLRRLLPRYRRVMRDAPDDYKALIDVQGREIVIAGDRDWGAAMETAVDPDSLAGYHDTPQLFVVDEASSRRLDAMYAVIEGALTTPGSCLVEIGNPTRTTGEFYQHHMRADLEPFYYRMHVSHRDAPTLISPQWVDTMRVKYGEESPVFKIRVLGEFADFDEAVLVPLEFIEEAYDADLESDGSFPRIRVAVDVADGGADATVITVARRYATWDHILTQRAYRFPPSVAVLRAAEAAVTLFEEFGGKKHTEDDMVIDANGVGAGTAGQLIQHGYNVKRHVGGENSSEPTRWRNRRVQNHMAMAERFSSGRVRIDRAGVDDVEEFELHMLAVKRAGGEDSRYDDIQTARDVKLDLGASPDRSASLSMIFFGSLPEYGHVSNNNENAALITVPSAVAYESF